MAINPMPSNKSWGEFGSFLRLQLAVSVANRRWKTVIFSELAKRYILETGKRVLILTHRIELLGQTSSMLSEIGVPNKIINSKVKELEESEDHWCYVAMVETLNNRLNDERIGFEDLGLVVVDEAHYNSFRKLFKHFDKQVLLGVTATPLSSNIKLPLHDNYIELIVGESIGSLVEQGFLAKANTYSYDVNLRALKVGINGDYTVSSSERLYGNFLMQEKLLYAYEEKAKGTKTLIFNNGINTSKQVQAMFVEEGYPCMHLDNTHSEKERADILEWFHTTPDAVLSSVSILTTGFDEPTVETIILNRATKSLTLYHQMIGRGSRVLKNKKEFVVIDLGNNARRFGLWDAHINWHDIFKSPNHTSTACTPTRRLKTSLSTRCQKSWPNGLPAVPSRNSTWRRRMSKLPEKDFGPRKPYAEAWTNTWP